MNFRVFVRAELFSAIIAYSQSWHGRIYRLRIGTRAEPATGHIFIWLFYIINKTVIFTAIIEVENLVKQFKVSKKKEGLKGAFTNLLNRKHKIVKAVDGISLSIEKGEMIGFIGPNGAGKSTTIKMLTGILFPSSGKVRVLDYIPFEQREQYTKHIGVVFGQRTQLWWDLPVVESFNLLKHIYEIPENVFKRNMRKFAEVLEINELLNTPVRKLSLGQRMRCDLAASLLHNPEVVFLDEPTIGLDLIAKEKIRKFIKEKNREDGTTFILTTHDMADIEELCERAIIIDKGKIIYDGSIDSIKKLAGEKRIEIEFEAAPKSFNINGAKVLERNENVLVLGVSKKRKISDIVGKILSSYEVVDLTIEELKIEEVVKKIYRKNRKGR